MVYDTERQAMVLREARAFRAPARVRHFAVHRPRGKGPELRCCFEIISPNKRAYMLQAMCAKDMQDWTDAIRSAIEAQLVGQPNPTSTSDSSSNHKKGMGSSRKSFPGRAGRVKALLEKNSVCADCSATSPDWVSLNLGAIVCLNCSGVHRSLGTHISKVRSLTLDQLSGHRCDL